MITKDLREDPQVFASKSTDFTMQASGKMFKMIMSGLYSKKAESITREIWSNAFDAHAMAGYPDKPFEVALPTRFNPQFYCRDFGEGLSDEWMNANYVVLGHSSKEDTNDAVGKWGVGRMSPTAYTDTFTVTSVHQGKKTVYNVTVKADGSPGLNTLVPTMETDEPSGLTISFPVNPSDINSFNTAAKRVALGFDVKPIVQGDSDYNWCELETTISGDGYSFYKSVSMISGPYIKMGCVLYPVKTSEVSGASWAANQNIIVDVKIGDVEVTASREDLSYGRDESTTSNLNKAFTAVKQALQEDTKTAVDSQDCLYDAFKVFYDSPLTQSLKRGFKFDGYDLQANVVTLKESYSVLVKQSWGSAKAVLTTQSSLKNVNLNPCYYYYKGGPKALVRALARIRVEANSSSRGFHTPLAEIEWNKETKKYNYESYNYLEKIFGESRMVNADTLPDVGVTKKSTRKTKVYDINFRDQEIDLTTGGIYFKSYSGNVQDVSYNTSTKHLVNTLVKAKLLPESEVVIVPKTHWKKFEDHADWKYIPDLVKEIKSKHSAGIANYLNSKVTVTDSFNLSQHASKFSGELKLYYDLIDADKGSYFGMDYSTVLSVSGVLSVKVDFDKNNEVAVKLRELVKHKYPMIEVHRNIEQKVEYILALDYYRAMKKQEKLKGKTND